MVKLEQRADGYYVFECLIDGVIIRLVLMDADKPLAEVSPRAEGFYFEISE